MKKVSVYFTDRQAAALQVRAAHAGITFAEALRRMLDECLAYEADRMPSPLAAIEAMSFEELRAFLVALERRMGKWKEGRGQPE